jgi:hypothetical protein
MCHRYFPRTGITASAINVSKWWGCGRSCRMDPPGNIARNWINFDFSANVAKFPELLVTTWFTRPRPTIKTLRPQRQFPSSWQISPISKIKLDRHFFFNRDSLQWNNFLTLFRWFTISNFYEIPLFPNYCFIGTFSRHKNILNSIFFGQYPIKYAVWRKVPSTPFTKIWLLGGCDGMTTISIG